MMHARIAVAVGGKQIAICGGHHLGGSVEWCCAAQDGAEVRGIAGIRRRRGPSDGANQVSFGCEHVHTVSLNVRAIEKSVDTEGNRMCELEGAIAKRPHEGT